MTKTKWNSGPFRVVALGSCLLLTACLGDKMFKTAYCVRPDGSKYIVNIYDPARDKCQPGEHSEPLNQ
jgi:hypothetical protein